MKDFEQSRATYNLMESVKYRTVLEWTRNALELGIYSNEQIIQEIDLFLKGQKNVKEDQNQQ